MSLIKLLARVLTAERKRIICRIDLACVLVSPACYAVNTEHKAHVTYCKIGCFCYSNRKSFAFIQIHLLFEFLNHFDCHKWFENMKYSLELDRWFIANLHGINEKKKWAKFNIKIIAAQKRNKKKNLNRNSFIFVNQTQRWVEMITFTSNSLNAWNVEYFKSFFN